MTLCSVEGCTARAKVRGFCKSHLAARREMDMAAQGRLCMMCDRGEYARGLCRRCYMRKLRGSTKTTFTPTKRAKATAASEMVEALITFTGDLALPQVQIRTAEGTEPMAIATFGVRPTMRGVSSKLKDRGFRPVGRLWTVDDLDEVKVVGTIRRTYRRD